MTSKPEASDEPRSRRPAVVRAFTSRLAQSRLASQMPDLEGRKTTGRTWERYQAYLAIAPEALPHKRVLDFGCGSSHIRADLRRLGITSDVVALDLRFDPWEDAERATLSIAGRLSGKVLRVLPDDGWLGVQADAGRRRLAGTAGRVIVQADGRAVPFLAGSFDYVLALWTTYQLPPEAKPAVYQELMRVGGMLHLGPIYRNDYDLLVSQAERLGFDVVACQPFASLAPFAGEEDYERYVAGSDRDERVVPPAREDLEIRLLLGAARFQRLKAEGGSTIILRRQPLLQVSLSHNPLQVAYGL